MTRDFYIPMETAKQANVEEPSDRWLRDPWVKAGVEAANKRQFDAESEDRFFLAQLAKGINLTAEELREQAHLVCSTATPYNMGLDGVDKSAAPDSARQGLPFYQPAEGTSAGHYERAELVPDAGQQGFGPAHQPQVRDFSDTGSRVLPMGPTAFVRRFPKEDEKHAVQAAVDCLRHAQGGTEAHYLAAYVSTLAERAERLYKAGKRDEADRHSRILQRAKQHPDEAGKFVHYAAILSRQ